MEEGTTTTPFDMAVLNAWTGSSWRSTSIQRVPRLAGVAGRASAALPRALQRHKRYVSEHGEDLPEVRNWTWTLS